MIKKPENKIYRAIMVELKTAEKFKKQKPLGKTNNEFMEKLLA